jgi:hypothetical protein
VQKNTTKQGTRDVEESGCRGARIRCPLIGTEYLIDRKIEVELDAICNLVAVDVLL